MSALGIIKHTQLFRHDPENGVYGDCWRATVASLLRLPIEEVPHVCDGPDDGKAGERMREFLDSQDCALIQVPFSGDMALEHVLSFVGSAPVSGGLHWCLMGTSRTGCNHVVICRGAEIVHDPSITQSGIVGPADDGFWWVEWIVKRVACDSASHVRSKRAEGDQARAYRIDPALPAWDVVPNAERIIAALPDGQREIIAKRLLPNPAPEAEGSAA